MSTEKDIEIATGMIAKEPLKAIEKFKQLVQQFSGFLF
jgi:hypothetical protein